MLSPFSSSRNDSLIATKTLIEMGASVHIKNDFGLYPIHLAASRGNKELCRVLLSYKEVVIDTTDQGLVCSKDIFVFNVFKKHYSPVNQGK